MASASFEEKFAIVKLDGTNYGTWKFKMKHFLIQKKCWIAVSYDEFGTVRPSEQHVNDAMSYIALSLKDDVIIHVQESSSAKEAWKNLAQVFEDAGTASKIVLQDELLTTKLLSGQSAQDHIAKMRTLVSKLKTVNVTISDDQ